MSAYFTEGFSVREPMWHGLGTVLDEYPGREEAMVLAGHDFEVLEAPIFGAEVLYDGRVVPTRVIDGRKQLVHSKTGAVLNVAHEDYGVVQNSVGWDIVDAMVGEGALYETGITMKEGAVLSVLAWLDEPVTIPGDDTQILPWLSVSWAHDGSGAVKVRPTSIRVVCWNTFSAAEAYGRKTDTEFTFRHSKNVMARIEDAKLAIRGVRLAHEEYVELASELAAVEVTDEQRELFASAFLPMPPEALISERVKANVEGARSEFNALFNGPTIPDAHRNTGYGLLLAGGEYLDHLRGYRNADTRYGRSLLRREPAKAKLTKLIREVANA